MREFRRQLLLSTTMLVGAFAGYARQAYAACANAGGSTYQCSGTNTSTQTVNTTDATVNTQSGFSVNTTTGPAVTVTGDGAISYTDNYASSLVTTGTSYGDDGLHVYSSGDVGATPGSVTIYTTGSAIGYTGIYARNKIFASSGAVNVTAYGYVKGAGTHGFGIGARNYGTDLTVTTGTQTVLGRYNGIDADNFGSGKLTITVNGDVTGTDAGGIFAETGNVATGDFTVTTATGTTASGGGNGIGAYNHGSGALTINAYGAATGISKDGIHAENSSLGGNLQITTGTGTVQGGRFGIYAKNSGNSLSITAHGDVNGTGAVSTSSGIWAQNNKGALAITTYGNVDGKGSGGNGVLALNFAGGSDATITTAAGTTVSGGSTSGFGAWGIGAYNYGSGGLTITANSDVVAYGIANTTGIFAANKTATTGGLTITANGDVTAANGTAIYAKTLGVDSGTGYSIDITTGSGTTTSSGADAIHAVNEGSGALRITANGDVTSSGSNGIDATNGTGATVLTVGTGSGATVSGYFYGIKAKNAGTGLLQVTTNGDVHATDAYFGAGISANNSNGTGLSITTATGTTVYGYSGISATNQKAALSIKAYGNVTVKGAYVGIGITAVNYGTTLDITTGPGTISGGYKGIYARNYGSGAQTITVNGDITVSAIAVDAVNESFSTAYGTDLTVTTAAGTTVSGGNYGITANNFGSGKLTVTANGVVKGLSAEGIDAFNSFSATDLEITTGTSSNVTGSSAGIYASNLGTGMLKIQAGGDVSASGASGIGIQAQNGNSAHAVGTDLTITTGTGTTIYGYYNGIVAKNYGSGALTITANGDVKSSALAFIGLHGIEARNSGTDLTISTAEGTTIYGNAAGIFAKNHGSGALTITPGGDVTSAGTAISAYNYGTDLDITTGPGTLTGNGSDGINASNQGSGHLKIEVNGDVTGKYTGINASNGGLFSSSGTNLSVTTEVGTTISGADVGIGGFNGGTGKLSVTANGDVKSTSTTGIGIDAYNEYSSTGNLTVTTGAGTTVYGGTGINANNQGTGGLKIDVNGDVSGTSAIGFGIYGYNYGTGSYLTVTTAAGTTVSGASGIGVVQYGSGALTVTVNGTVTGTSYAGIYALTGGPTANITVAAAGKVTSTGTGAGSYGIQIEGGSGMVTVAGQISGGSSGAVSFDQANPFNDTLTLEPGFAITGNVLAGTGTDQFVLGGASGADSFDIGSIGSAEQYRDFENFAKNGASQWTLTGTNTTLPNFTVNGGLLLANGTMPNTPFGVNTGATLGGSGTIGTTIINNGGTLAPGVPGTPGTLAIAGNLTLGAGSIYGIELTPTAHSLTSVDGTATIDSSAEVQLTPHLGTYAPDTIAILTSTGTRNGTFDPAIAYTGSFTLNGAALSYDANNVYLSYLETTNTLVPPTGATINERDAAGGVNNFILSGGTPPANFQSLAALSDGSLLNGLNQIDGENATGAGRGAFDLMSEFLGLMLDPSVDGRNLDGCAPDSTSAGPAVGSARDQKTKRPAEAAIACVGALKAPKQQPTFNQRWVWAAGFGSSATGNGNPVIGSTDVTIGTSGFATGMDFRPSPATMWGFSLAGGGTHWNLTNALGGGRSDAFLAGFYGTTRFGPAYVAGALGLANHWFSTNRTALGDHLNASFQGQSYGVRLEGGYRFAVPVARGLASLTPYAALQAQWFHTPAYAESDPAGGGFGLAYGAESGSDTRSELGARFDYLTTLNDKPLLLWAKAAWAHDWVSNPALFATFEQLPGSKYTVYGAPIPRDSALLSAGARYQISPNWSLGAKFDGAFSGRAKRYAATATLRVQW